MSSKKQASKKASTRASMKAGKKNAIDAKLLDVLVEEARAVRKLSYSPYSKYAVGAAIATRNGSIFVGTNVENASFGATICAERGAVMAMIAAGEREPIACAVVTGDREPASPCGICRQVLAEFNGAMPIAMVGLGSREGETGRVDSLADLLPHQFKLRR
jgi:cytidine deaminase